MIGDILVKVAKRELLTPQEELEIRMWGDAVESGNIFIAGMQTWNSDISANALRAFSGEFQRQPFSLASSIGFAASVPSSDLYTSATYNSSEYDELRGFTSGSTTFRVPFMGKYSFSVFSKWEANANSLRKLEVFVYGRGHIGGHQYAHCSESEPATVFFYEEASVPSGALININVSQKSGSTLACEGSAVIRLIRNHDADGYS